MTNTITKDSRQNPQAIVNRVTSIGIIGNVILSLFKFMAGVLYRMAGYPSLHAGTGPGTSLRT